MINNATSRNRALEKLRLGIAGVLVTSLVVTSVFRSMGYFIHDLYWLQEGLGGDKAVHCLMGAGLMLSALLVVMPRSSRSIAALLLAVLILLSIEEFSQLMATTREFDLSDLAANYAGAIVTTILFSASSYLLRHASLHKTTCNHPAPTE